VEEIESDRATGPGHVLDDDGGLARDVSAQMPGYNPTIHVRAAARRERYDEADSLSLGERFLRA
jgi:hypothetical protein